MSFRLMEKRSGDKVNDGRVGVKGFRIIVGLLSNPGKTNKDSLDPHLGITYPGVLHN